MVRLEPILTKEGVFYPNLFVKGIKSTIVLKEINEKAKLTQEHLNNDGKMLGFRAYHKLTGDLYIHRADISKQIGDPGIHVVLDNKEPVDYAENLNKALIKAHQYLFNNIVEEATILGNAGDVYSNILDTTKIGKEKFRQRKLNYNKANLNEEKINLPGHPAP